MAALDTPSERPEPKRDEWGRYLLPDPTTGVERSWRRATTLAKVLSDTYRLDLWEKRCVARGIALREDLALGMLVAKDNREGDRIVALAKAAAGGDTGSRYGTAMHTLTDRHDAGQAVEMTAAARGDFDAYAGVMADLEVIRSETIVLLPELGIAGTFDRIVRTKDGRLRVLDLKTGADLDWSWLEIVVQLNLYVRAKLMWDWDKVTWVPKPEVDQEVALVLHVPKGQGTAQLHAVDVMAGDELVYLATEVLRVRNLKDLATPVTPASFAVLAPVADASRPATASPSPVPEPAGAAQQPPAGDGAPIPPQPLGGPLPVTKLPKPADDGVIASDEDCGALAKMIADSEAHVVDRLRMWAKEADASQREFDRAPLTNRMWCCLRAAFALSIRGVTDYRVRDGLAMVVGHDVPDEWLIGAVIGSLTVEQADRLGNLAMGQQLDPF